MKEMENSRKENSTGPPDVAATVEAVFGCKWSLRILALIRQGVCHPGAIERAREGLTPKVQTYYFRRMVSLGILGPGGLPGNPTACGVLFDRFRRAVLSILDSIDELQRDLESTAVQP